MSNRLTCLWPGAASPWVMDIRVGTRERKVWLTGFVRSIADIHEADTVTREVNGVAVYNHLRIADHPFRT